MARNEEETKHGDETNPDPGMKAAFRHGVQVNLRDSRRQ
jgi:hypothetical protein